MKSFRRFIKALFFRDAADKPVLEMPQTGSICSIDNGTDGFRIVKVLVVDKELIHLKLFQNGFRMRPQTIDLGLLRMGADDEDEGYGMEHIPLFHADFNKWKPEILAFQDVQEGELTGYWQWMEIYQHSKQ